MRIRIEQLAGIGRLQYEDYVERVFLHLRKMYPEVYYVRTAAALATLVQRAIAKAASYGLEDEFTVLRFIDYSVLFGEEFDSLPEYAWMVRILRDNGRLELEKIRDIDRIQFGGAIEE
jgi:hypothetical protein